MHNDVGTPLPIFRQMQEEAGFELDFDYATSQEHKARLGVAGFYEEDQAQDREWLRDGFLHPPQNEHKEFLRHALRQCKRNHINIAMLVPARLIGARMFEPYWEEFIKDRTRLNIVPIWGTVIMESKVRTVGYYMKIYMRYGHREEAAAE